MPAKYARMGKGFTLIEMLVVVVIIGVLAACVMPNFIGARAKAACAQVKSNMHTCQLAAESYATDALGYYSSNSAGIQVYYPGGGLVPNGKPGKFPENPFTGAADVVTVGSRITNVTSAKAQNAGSLSGTAGNVEYDPITQSGGSILTQYAIIGFDNTGKSLPGSLNKQLVLSNSQ